MLWLYLAAVNFVFASTTIGKETNAVFQNIPKQIGQWKLRSKDEIFDRKTIFKHINGGAELYLAYGFQQALVRKYTDDTGLEILVDMYDMGSSADAYGVFSSEYDRADTGIGQEYEYADGLLRFWKNRYFVSIYSMGNDDKNVSPSVKKIGRRIASAIPTNGHKPDMLRWLPAHLSRDSKIRFFHTDLLLQKHLYIADENILDLSPKTDCLLIEQPTDADQLNHLLLIRYPNNEKATNAYLRFMSHIGAGKDTGSPIRTETLGWAWASVNQRILKIVLNAAGRQAALDMLKKSNDTKSR